MVSLRRLFRAHPDFQEARMTRFVVDLGDIALSKETQATHAVCKSWYSAIWRVSAITNPS